MKGASIALEIFHPTPQGLKKPGKIKYHGYIKTCQHCGRSIFYGEEHTVYAFRYISGGYCETWTKDGLEWFLVKRQSWS
jgi:hypothetical protein